MATVRMLNDFGIERFTAYLKRLADGEVVDPPVHLLEDPETSEALSETATVEPAAFPTKFEAAKSLYIALKSVSAEIDNNPGVWSWLSLFYFDQVCPADSSGGRTPGELARHVLSRHGQKYYRHLLAGPYRLLKLHEIHSRVFLWGPVTEHGDFSEQLASRMQVITNKPLIQAVDSLYFDDRAGGIGKPKRGALTRTRKGNLRRLIAIIQQFDLTYDMYAMTKQQILDLLPNEFASWRSG